MGNNSRRCYMDAKADSIALHPYHHPSRGIPLLAISLRARPSPSDPPPVVCRCKEEGLTNAEATRRVEIFGPNKLEHKETSAFLQFLS